jgi:hypothetical protein
LILASVFRVGEDTFFTPYVAPAFGPLFPA